MLALGALAEAPEFPGATAEVLFSPLETVGFPVDAVVHAAGSATARRSRRSASASQMSSTPTTSSSRGRRTARASSPVSTACSRVSMRRSSRPAGTRRCSTPRSHSRSARRSEEELERRVATLKEQYGDITLHRPAGLQHELFFSHLPRPDGWVVMRDYTQQLTVEQFGAMVATATRTLGSQRGPYLGYTPTGAPLPVRFDPSQAPREDRASAALLIGTLGSGKTVASETIEYAAERAGSLVVDFDPKPDHGLHKLPELEEPPRSARAIGRPSTAGAS